MSLKDDLSRANATILEQESALARANQAEKRLREEVRSAVARTGNVEEALAQVQAMFAREDRGWSLFSDYMGDEEDGLSLDDLKHWSGEIRQAVVGNPHIGRGLRFRRNFVWRDGVKYAGIPKGGRGGASANNVQQYIDDPMNDKHFFSSEARGQRELACFADGIYVVLGNQKTKKLRTLPLKNITGILRDPDNHDEIWAYRHSWIRKNPNGTSEERVEWVYVDLYLDKRGTSVNRNGVKEPVNQNLVAFDEHPNRAHGWALGAPDALAALIWGRIARDAIMDGLSMNAAMAKLYAQVTVPSKQAANSAAAALAQVTDAGATAVSGNQVNPLSTAGKGYQFDTLRPIIAIMATAMDVPTIALTSDTANAGSSYGAAQTLDSPTQYAMEERRAFHLGLEYRVLRWLGEGIANYKPKAHFKPLVDAADVFRVKQAANADWETGLWTPQQIKARHLALEGYDWDVTNWETIPADVMIPNNQAEPDSLTNDAQGDALAQQKSDAGSAASASGQGKSNPPSVGKVAQDQSTRLDR